MTSIKLPSISWQDNFGPEDVRRVTDLIFAALTDKLALPPAGHVRLLPVPTLYRKTEADIITASGRVGATEMRVVKLPRNGRCYAISDERQFRAMIPNFFRLGPPELTFIAANSKLGLTASEGELATFICKLLGGAVSAATRDVVGMHFDSGDLVELF